jgi:HK97 family phage prohead protease
MSDAAKQPKWDGTYRREVNGIEIREFNQEERWVDVVASTEALDRHNTVIDQASWNLKAFKKNPQIFWNHNQYGYYGGRPTDDLPIGRATNIKLENNELSMRIHFATAKVTEMAERVFQGFVEKVLRAVSVGFRPASVEKVEKGDKVHYRLIGCELREVSVVPIGSNPEALARGLAAEDEDLARWAERSIGHEPEGNESMSMTAEEQKLLSDAQRATGTAEANLKSETERATRLDTELTAERALVVQLKADLAKANQDLTAERAAHATTSAGVLKIELDLRQGKKFAPAEREKLENLARTVGMKEVLELIDVRADLAITEPLKGPDGKPLPLDRGAPPPVGGAEFQGSDDVIAEIGKRVASSTN